MFQIPSTYEKLLSNFALHLAKLGAKKYYVVERDIQNPAEEQLLGDAKSKLRCRCLDLIQREKLVDLIAATEVVFPMRWKLGTDLPPIRKTRNLPERRPSDEG